MRLQSLSLLLVSVSLWGHSGAQKVGGWTLRVHDDRFSGARQCTVSRGRVEVKRQALVIHLDRGLDTSNALYRIDDGAPIAVKTDQADLAEQGFQLQDENLDNPSAGLVRAPLRRLSGAHRIAIQTRPMTRATVIDISGLSLALSAARDAGCGADAFD